MIGTDAVRELIALAGGSIEGKTRLQKSAYFLESRGAGFGFQFAYHYYGPYSQALALAAEDAIALKAVSADPKQGSVGGSYFVFRAPEADAHTDENSTLRRKLLSVLAHYDTVTLELAATADFLAKSGDTPDSWLETERRKPAKATPARIENAKALLAKIEIVASKG